MFWIGPVGPCSPGIHLGNASATSPARTRISSCTKVIRRAACVSSTTKVITGSAAFCPRAATAATSIAANASSKYFAALIRFIYDLQSFNAVRLAARIIPASRKSSRNLDRRAKMHLALSPGSLMILAMPELIQPDSPSLWEVARVLVREYAASLGVSLDFQNFDDELQHFETKYARPDGAFLLARSGAEFLGCGALRRFSTTDCEMKRLYVRPAGRNLGLGRQLAIALVNEAKSLGYKRMLLDTLPTMQSAQSLYKSLGFVPTEPYRYNPIEGTSFLVLNL